MQDSLGNSDVSPGHRWRLGLVRRVSRLNHVMKRSLDMKTKKCLEKNLNASCCFLNGA